MTCAALVHRELERFSYCEERVLCGEGTGVFLAFLCDLQPGHPPPCRAGVPVRPYLRLVPVAPSPARDLLTVPTSPGGVA